MNALVSEETAALAAAAEQSELADKLALLSLWDQMDPDDQKTAMSFIRACAGRMQTDLPPSVAGLLERDTDNGLRNKKWAAARYCFPARMLRQRYFCYRGDGAWTEPRLTLHVLGHEYFDSPLNALLARLEWDGCNVEAARIEYTAYLELAREHTEHFRALAVRGIDAEKASKLYQDSTRRTK